MYYNIMSHSFQILLHPMHKYTIKVVIDQVAGSNKMVLPLPNTTFIAVSSYHNIELIKLKINKNPSPYDFKQQTKDSQNVSKDGLPQTPVGIGEHFKENGHTIDAPTPNESSELFPKENGHTIDDTVSKYAFFSIGYIMKPALELYTELL